MFLRYMPALLRLRKKEKRDKGENDALVEEERQEDRLRGVLSGPSLLAVVAIVIVEVVAVEVLSLRIWSS